MLRGQGTEEGEHSISLKRVGKPFGGHRNAEGRPILLGKEGDMYGSIAFS